MSKGKQRGTLYLGLPLKPTTKLQAWADPNQDLWREPKRAWAYKALSLHDSEQYSGC